MTLDAPAIENLIYGAIPEASVKVDNLRNDGRSFFSVHVAAPCFKGLTRVQQHQMVYAALKGHVDVDAQPISLRTSVSS